jgi:hypothetical protein
VVKLLIQPQDGIAELLSAIKSAKQTIEIVIFRFDRAEIEAAVKAALHRGVSACEPEGQAEGMEAEGRKAEVALMERSDERIVTHRAAILGAPLALIAWLSVRQEGRGIGNLLPPFHRPSLGRRVWRVVRTGDFAPNGPEQHSWWQHD